MVRYTGSPTYTVYVDVTLSRSKVKVMGLLNLRQLAKACMLAAMTAAPLRGFLVKFFSIGRLSESIVDILCMLGCTVSDLPVCVVVTMNYLSYMEGRQ